MCNFENHFSLSGALLRDAYFGTLSVSEEQSKREVETKRSSYAAVNFSYDAQPKTDDESNEQPKQCRFRTTNMFSTIKKPNLTVFSM